MHLIWSLEPAGAEKVAYELLEGGRSVGFDPHVCILSDGEPSPHSFWKPAEMTIHRIVKRPGKDLGLVLRLKRRLIGERISILHTHNSVGAVYGGLAARWAGVRHIHTEHSNVESGNRLLRWFYPALVRRAEIVADSKKVAVLLARRDGVPDHRIRVIYNGVQVPDRTVDATSKYIGTIGNLRPVKDHRNLIEAFSQIESNHPDWKLVIVGEGSERKSLEELIESRSLSHRIDLRGRQPAPEVLPQFSIFALSSKSEGLPLSLLEAMATGCACVSTSVGGIPEVILDQVHGLLVPNQSATALARALDHLIRDSDLRSRLGNAARNRVISMFNRTQMVRAYTDLYGDAA